ncbi:MAG: zinc-dependent metalloprotease, partial [Cyanobacteria bacterium P01_G01_bin.38]
PEVANTEDSAASSETLPNGLQPFDELTEGLEKQSGLFTLYSDLQTGKAYLALRPEQLNQNFLLVATLESGIGEAGLWRGWPINDLLVQFRDAPNDRLQVVVPNTYVRNPDGQDWQQRLLDGSFSDSVIFAIKVVSIDPQSQAKLIDLSKLLIESDLANLKNNLGWGADDYKRSAELSRIDHLAPFPNNLEIGTTVGFLSDGGSFNPFAALFGLSPQGLADDRGFTLGIRYSLSDLPTHHGYRPRLADQRVGYFLSAFRAPLRQGQTDPFVRYINRWHLEKQTPEADLSPPKEPIVFWIENTVPPAYREALREGVLLWNEAFEKAGFENAVEVRQMPDNADWDPADVRYNVIRWTDSLRAGFSGLGPRRVNPLTGEILDADILISAHNLQSLERQYQTLGPDNTPEVAAYWQLCGQRSQTWYLKWLTHQKSSQLSGELAPTLLSTLDLPTVPTHHYCAGYLDEQNTTFGALALAVRPELPRAQSERYIRQFLVALTAHEVGHALGLRHNFAGSRLLTPDQLHDPDVTHTQGLTSSMMDYFPPNIAPPGVEQGDFFPTRVGAYDLWAIEYGYRPVSAAPLGWTDHGDLAQIAARSNLSELAYATDEDVMDFIDPEVNRWDLSSDPLQFAIWQLDNAQAVWQRLNRLSVNRGEGYGSLRRRVDLVFGYFGRHAATLTNYIGGQRFRRLDPWGSGEQTPLEPIPAAKQREALNVLNQAVFASDAFNFSPQLLNQLPPDLWRHWGVQFSGAQLDYPIYDRVLVVQSMALSNLMFSERLARVRDLEFKSDSEDVFTLTELFDTVYQGIWSEISPPETVAFKEAVPEKRVPDISSLRRGLQRHYLNILSNLVLRRSFEEASVQSFTDYMALEATVGAPEDARVLARYQLRQMYEDIEKALSQYNGQMTITTQAHLEDIRDRIQQVLEAPLLGA